MQHPGPLIALLQSSFVLLMCVAALMGMLNVLRGRSFWGGYGWLIRQGRFALAKCFDVVAEILSGIAKFIRP